MNIETKSGKRSLFNLYHINMFKSVFVWVQRAGKKENNNVLQGQRDNGMNIALL